MKPFAVNAVLPAVAEIGDPFEADCYPVAPHVRRAVLHAIRSDIRAFYVSATYLAGQQLPLFETLTGDYTAPCPLPCHPVPSSSSATESRTRRGPVSASLETSSGTKPPRTVGPASRRPLRIHHAHSGAGWRCSACGSGSPVQFLNRLFFLPSTSGDAAAWNLAALMLDIDPAKVDARAWLPWDSDRAHFEWGSALAYTRANIQKLRPLYREAFPIWRDAEIMQFPATGRGTYLVAYRVRGRLTQLEEVPFLSARQREDSDQTGTHPNRRLRFHHWSTDRPTRLARSITGVYPDTPSAPPDKVSLPGGVLPPLPTAHLVQGAEHAASLRAALGSQVIGASYGPPGLGQAEVDALAQFSRVYVWADQTPSGRGFQNQMVRLLRACGVNARRVRWSEAGNVPRGYHVTALLRDGGEVRTTPDGMLHLRLAEQTYSQTILPFPEVG